MPELRKDPVSGRWVIISVERGKRPTDFVSPSQKRKAGGFCPFCPGNEHTAPPEIIAFRPCQHTTEYSGLDLARGAEQVSGTPDSGELNKMGEGIFDKMNGVGAHEVIIETPDHEQSLATMQLRAVEDVFWAYYFSPERS